jgi:putative transposase
MFTPNEKYAALVEAAGYVPVALGPDDYIELLPACWRAVNSYGIKISHRRYDCEELNPLRMQPSGVAARKNLWEVHHDPYVCVADLRARPGRVDHLPLAAP